MSGELSGFERGAFYPQGQFTGSQNIFSSPSLRALPSSVPMADREAQFLRCLGLFSGDDGPGPARVGTVRAMAINGVAVAASSPPPTTMAPQPLQRLRSRPPPLPLPPASAREFLLSRPPGAYTAISVSSSGCAQFWQEHCERLAATLAILSEEEREEGGEREEKRQEPPLFPLFRAWHAASEGGVPLPLPSLVGDALLPGVRAAVAAVRDLQRAEMEAFVAAEAVPAAEGGDAANNDDDDDEELKGTAPVSSSRCAGSGPVNVVALLTDPAGDPEQRQQSFQHPESLPLDVAVFAWEAPRAPFWGSAAASAAAAAATAFNDASDVPSSPSASSSSSESRPSSSSASEGPAFIPVLSAAVVVGGPRERPHAKDSRWVRDRQPLERKLAEAAVVVAGGEGEEEGGVAASAGGGACGGSSLPASSRKEREGLLADEQGRLLEGLLTNVFVVVADDDEDEDEEARAWAREEEEGAGHRRRGGAVDLSRFSLHTAAASDGGGGGPGPASILDGVMRRAVLEAAESLELRVVASRPDPRGRRRWREAFVTSALRGVAAVARVQGGGQEGGMEPWSVDFSSGGGGGGGLPGLVTREIADALPGVTWRHEVKL